MKASRRFGQGAVAALLCLSLAVWAVLPAVSHASAVFETLKERAATIAEHGHAHGEGDLHRALHGHGHEASDHDHSEAMQAPAAGPGPACAHAHERRRPPSRAGPTPSLRIDRPPRA